MCADCTCLCGRGGGGRCLAPALHGCQSLMAVDCRARRMAVVEVQPRPLKTCPSCHPPLRPYNLPPSPSTAPPRRSSARDSTSAADPSTPGHSACRLSVLSGEKGSVLQVSTGGTGWGVGWQSQRGAGACAAVGEGQPTKQHATAPITTHPPTHPSTGSAPARAAPGPRTCVAPAADGR